MLLTARDMNDDDRGKHGPWSVRGKDDHKLAIRPVQPMKPIKASAQKPCYN